MWNRLSEFFWNGSVCVLARPVAALNHCQLIIQGLIQLFLGDVGFQVVTLRVLVDVRFFEVWSNLLVAGACPPLIDVQIWWFCLDCWSDQLWAHGVGFILVKVLGGARFSVHQHRVGFLQSKLRLVLIFKICLLLFLGRWRRLLDSFLSVTGRYLQVVVEETQIIKLHFNISIFIVVYSKSWLFVRLQILATRLIIIRLLVNLGGPRVRIRHFGLAFRVIKHFPHGLSDLFFILKFNTRPFRRRHRHISFQKLFLQNLGFLWRFGLQLLFRSLLFFHHFGLLFFELFLRFLGWRRLFLEGSFFGLHCWLL